MDYVHTRTHTRFSRPNGDTHTHTKREREEGVFRSLSVFTYDFPDSTTISLHWVCEFLLHNTYPSIHPSLPEREITAARLLASALIKFLRSLCHVLSFSSSISSSVFRTSPCSCRAPGPLLIHGGAPRTSTSAHHSATLHTHTSDKKKKKEKNAMTLTRFFPVSSLAMSTYHSLSLSLSLSLSCTCMHVCVGVLSYSLCVNQ